MESYSSNEKRPIKKILLWVTGVFIVIIIAVGFYLSYNLNPLLSDALRKSFNSSIISEVYELKFEKLSANFFLGNIHVYNVELQPRAKPLHSYPYINSSFRLKAHKMLLANVQLFTLFESNRLVLDRIEITEPDVELKLDGDNYILLPFKDTTGFASQGRIKDKKPFGSFFLKEFELVNASFQVTNSAKEREFRIQKLNISLRDLMIIQQPGMDLISNKHVDLSIGEFSGSFKKKSIKYLNFRDYKTTLDSFDIHQTLDTVVFHFTDFSTVMKMLDIQTADSIFHLTLKSFNLSYKTKSISLTDAVFRPNIRKADIEKRFTYQTPQFSGTVDSISLFGVNFDALIYNQKLFINEIVLDRVSASIFKDQRKPIDKNRFPQYLGQQIKAFPIPILIKHLKARNIDLANTELKPDGTNGKININRATLNAKNITNLPSDEMLSLNADAYIENKAHLNLSLSFKYQEQQFSMNGIVKSFNLPDLNPFLKSYTPASIKTGTADEITFSGNAYRTYASGTMKFLYHNLDIDVKLHEKAKWKSDVIAFAANTYLAEANPASTTLPARVVKFHVDRDMNKGFINILIKSILNGVKETMIMSKENRKAYHEAKKKAKKQGNQLEK